MWTKEIAENYDKELKQCSSYEEVKQVMDKYKPRRKKKRERILNQSSISYEDTKWLINDGVPKKDIENRFNIHISNELIPVDLTVEKTPLREQVLELVQKGYTREEIEAELLVTKNAVYNHFSALRKLGYDIPKISNKYSRGKLDMIKRLVEADEGFEAIGKFLGIKPASAQAMVRLLKKDGRI